MFVLLASKLSLTSSLAKFDARSFLVHVCIHIHIYRHTHIHVDILCHAHGIALITTN